MQALPDGTVIRFGLKWLPKNSSLYCFPLEKLWFHQENKSLVRKLNYKVWYIATRQQSLRVTLVLGLQLVSAYDVGGHEEILKTSESFSEVVCLSHSQQRNNQLGLVKTFFFFFWTGKKMKLPPLSKAEWFCTKQSIYKLFKQHMKSGWSRFHPKSNTCFSD